MKALKILALLLAALLLFTACGNDTPGTTDNPPTDDVTPDTPNDSTDNGDEAVLTYPVEEVENFLLWSGSNAPDYASVTKLNGEEYVIYDTDAIHGTPKFAHGVSVEEFNGALVASWAYNEVAENTPGEQLFGRWSYDGGKTWGDDFEIKPHTEGRSASHGVFFVESGKLYYLLPAADFTVTPWTITTELHVWNEQSKCFEYVDDACAAFWPNSKPVKLANGEWFCTGAGMGRTMYATTKDGDVTTWRVKQIALPTETKFTESAAIVNQNQIVIVMRNTNVLSEDTLGIRDEGRYYAGVAVSYDYGKTFTKAELSNVYASPSKLFGGTLSDGRPYLIFNMMTNYNDSRQRLLIGIGDAGTGSINKFYTVATHIGSVSYPYAMEIDGKLYVTYSQASANKHNGNQNDIMLKIIDISDIK